MKSMTGFGQAHLSLPGKSYVIEMRSLNGRFLEVRVRMPWAYLDVESKIVESVRDTLFRGKIDVVIGADDARNLTGEEGLELQLNVVRARELRIVVEQLTATLNCSKDAAVALMPTVKDLVGPGGNGGGAWPAAEKLWEMLSPCLEEALSSLVAMRNREGLALKKHLQDHLAQLVALKTRIAERTTGLATEYYRRFRERVANLLDGIGELDQSRVAQEVALLADRFDTTEELQRLDSHFEQLTAVMAEDGPVGRKIDFLLQEMNREFNTLGAKSFAAEISNLVFEGKNVLEKMREQVQNVE